MRILKINNLRIKVSLTMATNTSSAYWQMQPPIQAERPAAASRIRNRLETKLGKDSGAELNLIHLYNRTQGHQQGYKLDANTESRSPG